jgi:dethiobiotin synthetase
VKAWFVTGTDTGAGKTTVTLAILAEAARLGRRTAAMKPVESGCQALSPGSLAAPAESGCQALSSERLEPADARLLALGSSVEIPLETVCPYRYQAPLAPALAARAEGNPPQLERIAECYRQVCAAGPEVVLVEGAGGLLVPLSESMLMADLAAALDLPLLIVARDSLGTINHTALTVEVARGRGLEVAGVILNGADPATPVKTARDNAAEIERITGAKVVGILAHGGIWTEPLSIEL